MADRGPVKIRQSKIDALIKTYKATYKRMVEEIQTATESGKINAARVMARINLELKNLGVDVSKWVKTEIPQYYLDGANAALQDLRALGVDVSNPRFAATVNKAAVEALVNDVNASFADSIQTLSRNSRKFVSKAQKLQLNAILAQGKLAGDTRDAIAALVEKQLKDKGINGLVDKSGRQWSFEDYAQMLVRTKSVEARNEGLKNKMLQNGYDLVQVTDHNSKHPACKQWEGKILSITGQTTGELDGGFQVAGTVEEATAAGLFHPNCEHAINVISPSLAAKTSSYDATASIDAGEPVYKKGF